MTEIAENVTRVRSIMAEACQRVGREPDSVQLIAVSKKKPASDILAAVAAGVQHFGENRVEEAQEKIPLVQQAEPGSLFWHMIGHIQSRKAKYVPGMFDVVHSVDSVKIAERLSQQAEQAGTVLQALVQVNVSGEETKGGFAAYQWHKDTEVFARLESAIETIVALPGLRIVGLMTMAPFVADSEQVRPVFASTFALREALVSSLQLALPHLSMGMTDDYPVAIEEGATMVRIGRAIFGERKY